MLLTIYQNAVTFLCQFNVYCKISDPLPQKKKKKKKEMNTSIPQFPLRTPDLHSTLKKEICNKQHRKGKNRIMYKTKRTKIIHFAKLKMCLRCRKNVASSGKIVLLHCSAEF